MTAVSRSCASKYPPPILFLQYLTNIALLESAVSSRLHNFATLYPASMSGSETQNLKTN